MFYLIYVLYWLTIFFYNEPIFLSLLFLGATVDRQIVSVGFARIYLLKINFHKAIIPSSETLKLI